MLPANSFIEAAEAGDWLAAIELLNAGHRPVLAVDIPTGLHADTGLVPGVDVQADLTVTFIGRKPGLYTGQGPEIAGKVVFDELQVPASVYRPVLVLAEQVTGISNDVPALRRSRTAHKGHHGHVLVIGGEQGMGGAAQLAGLAAGTDQSGRRQRDCHSPKQYTGPLELPGGRCS